MDAVPAIRVYLNGTDLGYHLDDVFNYSQPKVLSAWVLEKLQPVVELPSKQYKANRNYVVAIGCEPSAEFNTARLRDNYNEYVCSSTNNIDGISY